VLDKRSLYIEHSHGPYLPTPEPALPVDRPPLPTTRLSLTFLHHHYSPQYNTLASSVPHLSFPPTSRVQQNQGERETEPCLPLVSWGTSCVLPGSLLPRTASRPFFYFGTGSPIRPSRFVLPDQRAQQGPIVAHCRLTPTLSADHEGLPCTLGPAYTCPTSPISSHGPSRHTRSGHIYLSKTLG
jgi:hypothetical protein